MELLWELALTIALSLLLPLVFLKLLSVTPNFEANEKVAVIGRDRDRDRDRGVKSDSQGWETEEVVRIVGEIDEFREKPILGKLMVPEIVDVSCGSPKIRNSGNTDENRVYNEIKLVDFVEDPVVKNESNQGINKINELEVEKVEEIEISQCERNYNEIDEFSRSEEVGENKAMVVDEDDWEGIESSELEQRFGAAVVFVGSKSNANLVANLCNDVKMKLHGYHRIATHGPCQEPQPMALNFSARAKWIARRQLGIMSPELAMEQYIALLSENIPNWMADYPYDNARAASAN
ncbi:acyl-CoA-binding domain-containing protein 3-like isoform X2 [Abrus precatorius]|uniref:Acyl-CoA-binding domain-containing protein 3-like isoform X2 n=1 Tax=Abrus precatorius TaxID=3816 RepID=A0A8B8M2F0_ABRPR|nr:acyl-CoA-binding domain-containing protein 3-like isoform X2 [Abrus precatorius]